MFWGSVELLLASTSGTRTGSTLDLLVDLETLVGLFLLHSMHQSWSYAWVSCPHHYVPPFRGIPTPPSYYGGPPIQACWSGAPLPPQNYVVPNVTFVEPYTQYSQPQQSMAIIGGYAARNMQNVATIQSNAAQLGEGNANIAYERGRLHLVSPDQFVGGDVQTYYEQG
jgi:hypothetical protein